MAMVADSDRRALNWVDLVWLAFLAGLAMLNPVADAETQLTLLALGVFQLLESHFIRWMPPRGAAYSVLIKIGRASCRERV